MLPISQLEAPIARKLEGLLFDLDDTLLSHGKLEEEAYRALFRLKEARLRSICVTGRPAAWGRLFVRQWPIDAAVCENGAIALREIDGRPTARWLDEPVPDATQSTRLGALVLEVQKRWPVHAAEDAQERLTDFTFDIGEYEQVNERTIDEITAFARSRGARTTRSSVHLHLSFSGHDKASGTIAFLRRELGCDSTRALGRFAYIGDSENDAACFAAFHCSIGVQNLRGRPTVFPRFLTSRPRGAGFAEAAARLSDLRALGS